MRRLPAVKLSRLPRMADFALWATAGERALGLADGTFITAYSGNRQGANQLAIEASPVAGPLLALMEATAEWTGTASELLAALDAKADDRTRRLHGWPKGAAGVGRHCQAARPQSQTNGHRSGHHGVYWPRHGEEKGNKPG